MGLVVFLKKAGSGLASALGFLTVLPMGGNRGFYPAAMAPWFSVVGLFIGVGAGVVDVLTARFLWPQPAASLVVVFFLAVVTGGLHLDGLADTADGLFSHRSRERALSIMKDSRVGVMGALGLVFLLLIKLTAVAHLACDRFLILTIVPALARGGLLFAMGLLPYGRSEGGLGRAFFEKPLSLKAFLPLCVPVGLCVFLGIRGAVLAGGFLIISGIVMLWYKKRMNCVTGDMLGALVEILEAGLFAVASIRILLC